MNAIREAAERLPGRWFKGGMCNGNNTKFCGIGWLWEVAAEENKQIPHKEGDLMDEVAIEQYPDRIGDGFGNRPFAEFNDHPDTTEDEVVAIMEKAAVRWDEQHG